MPHCIVQGSSRSTVHSIDTAQDFCDWSMYRTLYRGSFASRRCQSTWDFVRWRECDADSRLIRQHITESQTSVSMITFCVVDSLYLDLLISNLNHDVDIYSPMGALLPDSAAGPAPPPRQEPDETPASPADSSSIDDLHSPHLTFTIIITTTRTSAWSNCKQPLRNNWRVRIRNDSWFVRCPRSWISLYRRNHNKWLLRCWHSRQHRR